MTDPTAPDTVVLVHGLWMTPLSWQPWIEKYEAPGLTVLTPTWPRMDRPIEELRDDPSIVGGLGITEVVDHFAAIVKALPTPPILIGHSIGGLIVQLLLDRGLGVAGVAIDSGQTKGVLGLPLVQLRAAFPVLGNPLNRTKGVPLTAKQFHFAFANSLSEAESNAIYTRFHVPAPARPLFQAAFANFRAGGPTKVDYRKADRAPLLFIAGGADHIVPPSVNRENHKRYKAGIVEYVEFPGRSHITCAAPGWEAVADKALSFSLENVGK